MLGSLLKIALPPRTDRYGRAFTDELSGDIAPYAAARTRDQDPA